MTPYDTASFAAGQEAGARVAASVARLAAFQLVLDASWWNRRRRRLMARALVACAGEMETAADGWGDGEAAPRPDGARGRGPRIVAG